MSEQLYLCHHYCQYSHKYDNIHRSQVLKLYGLTTFIRGHMAGKRTTDQKNTNQLSSQAKGCSIFFAATVNPFPSVYMLHTEGWFDRKEYNAFDEANKVY